MADALSDSDGNGDCDVGEVSTPHGMETGVAFSTHVDKIPRPSTPDAPSMAVSNLPWSAMRPEAQIWPVDVALQTSLPVIVTIPSVGGEGQKTEEEID